MSNEPDNAAPQHCIRGGGVLRPGEAQPPLPSSEVPDYGQYAVQGETIANAGETLNALVREAQGYEREIVEAEEALKKAKDKLRAVVQDALPKAMKEAGLPEFTTESGITVKVKDKIENSIPAARREEAWDWLEQNGHSDILKREVTVAFGVTEGELAKQVAMTLQQEHNRSVLCQRKAEPATVKALLARLIEDKKSVPRDLFGVRELTVAEFKTKK